MSSNNNRTRNGIDETDGRGLSRNSSFKKKLLIQWKNSAWNKNSWKKGFQSFRRNAKKSGLNENESHDYCDDDDCFERDVSVSSSRSNRVSFVTPTLFEEDSSSNGAETTEGNNVALRNGSGRSRRSGILTATTPTEPRRSNSLDRAGEGRNGGLLEMSGHHRSMRSRRSTFTEEGNFEGRSTLTGLASLTAIPDFEEFVRYERVKEWLKHFRMLDPRFRILKFFNDVANEGATGTSVDFKRDHVSPLLKYFSRASVFTVWRPTSKDAIRRMMVGEGVGKGLDIKGKSAKRGKLSAFVPFLQIHKEDDKEKIRTLRRNGRIRVFFTSKHDRDLVVENLKQVAIEMEVTVRDARQIINNADDYDEEVVENALKKITLDMEDSTIDNIDAYASTSKYGMEVQERLFWEGMVARQNISRKPGTNNDTGRTSMPSFQDMNLDSLRKPRNSIPGGHTRAVILQLKLPDDSEEKKDGDSDEYHRHDPMSPLNFVMAYEENDPEQDRRRVIPCVSDFDCFIVGSRRVKYVEPVPDDQLEILKWMIEQTELVLETPNEESWTKRWLEILKNCSRKGFHPTMPPNGYSDPKTRFIFKFAINRLSITGAVRHGAECFNYYFPQELDDDFLVISDDLPEKYGGRNWVYVDQYDLQEILKYKIHQGFTFPLNPKWVLCDPGWKEVYDELFNSKKPNVKESLDCWFPPNSGIRESIDRIHEMYPHGFERNRRACMLSGAFRRNSSRLSYIDGTAAMDLARQELKYYLIFQRARRKLRGILLMNRILANMREEKREERRLEKIRNQGDQPSVEDDTGIENTQASKEEQDCSDVNIGIKVTDTPDPSVSLDS
mmetsp:Transcript_18787/g.52487  ORF Transcript_18787/g.52487 Transcript_18787/m.52487 type:complete len:837 (+) Transcript_18787:293-2803(+)